MDTGTGTFLFVDHLAFRKAMLAPDMSVCGGLHISPRGAPSRGAKLCTHWQLFARTDRANTEPYDELSLPVAKLRSIFHFQLGAHSLPVEQGRIEMPQVPFAQTGAFVPPMLSATSVIVSLIALIFRSFGSSMHRFSRILKMP